eukprot:scaffold4973_cov135-Cylindrotheca_fusiformis.AAC.30
MVSGREMISPSAGANKASGSGAIVSPPEAARRQSLQEESFQKIMKSMMGASDPNEHSDGAAAVDHTNALTNSMKSGMKKVFRGLDIVSPTSSKDYHRLVEDQVELTPPRPSSMSCIPDREDDDSFHARVAKPASLSRRSNSSSFLPFLSGDKSPRTPHHPKSTIAMSPKLNASLSEIPVFVPFENESFGDDSMDSDDLSIEDDILQEASEQDPILSYHNKANNTAGNSTRMLAVPIPFGRAVSEGTASYSRPNRSSWAPRPPTMSRGYSGGPQVHVPFATKDAFGTNPFEQPISEGLDDNPLNKSSTSMDISDPDIDDFNFEDPFEEISVVKSKSFSGPYGNSVPHERTNSISLLEEDQVLDPKLNMTDRMTQNFAEALDLDPFDDGSEDLHAPSSSKNARSTQPTSKTLMSPNRSKSSRMSDGTASTAFSSSSSFQDFSSPDSRRSVSRIDEVSLSHLITQNKDQLRSGSKASLSTNSGSLRSGDIDSMKGLSVNHDKTSSGRSSAKSTRRHSSERTPIKGLRRWNRLMPSAGPVPKEPSTPSSSNSTTKDFKNNSENQREVKTELIEKKKIRQPRRNSDIEPRTMRIGMDGSIDMMNSPHAKESRNNISRVTSIDSIPDLDPPEHQARRSKSKKKNKRQSKSPKPKRTPRHGSMNSLKNLDTAEVSSPHKPSSSRRKKSKRESASPKRPRKLSTERESTSKVKTKGRRSDSTAKHTEKKGLRRPSSTSHIEESLMMVETEQLHMPKNRHKISNRGQSEE